MAGTDAGTFGELLRDRRCGVATQPHVLTLKNAKGIILAKHLVLLDTLDRDNLSVEMHQKATVRTAIITDDSTGHQYKIEGKRISSTT